MKIHKPEMSILTLETSTFFFKLLGILFLGAGAVMLYFMTDSYTLKCEQQKSQCVLTHHQWLLSHEIAIEHIKRAKITYTRSKQGSKNYYLKLKTSDGSIYLNQIASPGKIELRKNALLINRYIRTPRDGLITIKNLYPWWFILLPLVFIFVSVLIIFLPKKTFARFDRLANVLTIRRQNIFSKKETQYALSDVQKVILEETTGKNGRLYRIAFVFKDDTVVPLTDSFDNFLPSKIKSIDAICEFLHLAKGHELTDKVKKQKKLALIIFIIALSFIAESAYLLHSGILS